jgi:hypothetical protein
MQSLNQKGLGMNNEEMPIQNSIQKINIDDQSLASHAR